MGRARGNTITYKFVIPIRNVSIQLGSRSMCTMHIQTERHKKQVSCYGRVGGDNVSRVRREGEKMQNTIPSVSRYAYAPFLGRVPTIFGQKT